jgi:AsmA protein
MNRALKVIGIIVAILIVIVIAAPFLINVNDFRPRIEAELSNALGRPVTVGNLHLSLLSGSVAADDLSIADDPSFSQQPFIKAKDLKVGVEMIPLITSKALHITNITLDQPQVSLLRSPAGKWNFSSLGTSEAKANTAKTKGAAPEKTPATQLANPSSTKPSPAEPASSAPSSSEPTSNPNLSIAKLNVKDGRVTVGNVGSAKQHVYDKLNIGVQNFSFTSEFPFTLTANLPGGGNVGLEGKAGPIDASDASLTPLDAKINVKQLDLAASGFIEPSSGISGLADIASTVNSNGKQAESKGTVNATRLKLSPKGSPAPTPVQVKYTLIHDLQKQAGQLTEGDVIVGKAVAKLTGGYRIEPEGVVLNMKLNADGMPVNDVETLLPALGVTLPSGSSLQGGTLTADLTIQGPVDKLVIDGPVKLSDTKLAGFSLGSKLAAVSKFTGGGQSTGSDTVIQNFSAHAHVAPNGITTDNVNLTIPSLGVVTGNGTISPNNTLNYKMNAALSGTAVSGLTQMAGVGGKGGTLPFTIEGTTSDPKVMPDVKGLMNSQLKSGVAGQLQNNGNNSNNVVNAIGGLFGKKKPK